MSMETEQRVNKAVLKKDNFFVFFIFYKKNKEHRSRAQMSMETEQRVNKAVLKKYKKIYVFFI